MANPNPTSQSSSSTLGVREDMRTFFYPKENEIEAQQRRDLFILGFQRFMSLPKEDPNSYVQLASVHGRPMSVGYGVDAPPTETDNYLDGDPLANPLIKMKYVDNDGNGQQFSSMGVSEFAYCKHGRPTFMTWHRPYVYLVEQAIRKAALFLVDNGMIQGDLQAAKKQVHLINLPYWNWAIDAPVPDVLLCDYIELTQFSLYGQGSSSISSEYSTSRPHRTQIKNPFKSFQPTKEQYKYFNGEVPEPDKFDAPQGVPGTLTDYAQNCVFGPSGTLRQEGWNDYLYRFLVRDLRKNIVEGIMRSNFIAPDGKLTESASHWMESAHNALHNSFSIALTPEYGMPPATTAPTRSDMTGTRKLNPTAVIVGRSAMINDMSTMDPAFWFHHCFVDCHLAMHRHAYPDGVYIPASIKQPANWTADEYYAPKDPVPLDSDLEGRSREWLLSAFHPWSKGLFPKIFHDYKDDVDEERKKIRQQQSGVVQYVNSQDVESNNRWGYTYDMLLRPDVRKRHPAQVSTENPKQWITPQEAQAKFLFEYMDDPFYKVVHDAQKEFDLPKPLWQMDFDQIPDRVLRKLRAAAVTIRQWRLKMVLPKFFKVDDGLGVGRSYTVNVFLLGEKEKIPIAPSPADPSFAGSASVFAPFNLRQCLNCQQNNTQWPVSVDLTEAVIAHGYTMASDDEILSRLFLDPIGVPKNMLPADPDKYKTEWKAQVISQEAKQPSQDKTSIPYKLFEWKKMLAESSAIASVFSLKIDEDKSFDNFKNMLRSLMKQEDFDSVMVLMTERNDPDSTLSHHL